MAQQNEAFGFNIDLNELVINNQKSTMEKVKEFVDTHNTYITLGLAAVVGWIAYKVFGR